MASAVSRVLIVTNIPTPYRLPLFNEIAARLEGLGFRLKVAFAASGYARRRWAVDLAGCRFEHEILGGRGVSLAGNESPSFSYGGLYDLIRREQPSVTVVTGYSPATVKLWLRSLWLPTPYVIWSGTIASAQEPVGALRQLQRRLLVRRAAGFIAYGSLARDYLVSIGAAPERIQIGINTVDTDFFRREAAALRGASTPPECLCVGDLTERKRPDLALRAFAAACAERADAVLTFVGDGPLRASLETLAAELGVAAQVRFAGFRQRAELPAFLARARCLVFPTGFDIWGLVLPEAMAAGVPCLASIHAGATRDLVVEGETGFAVDFADTAVAASRLRWFFAHPAEAAAMGEACRRHIEERANLGTSAAGFVAAIRGAVGATPRLGVA
jgi:glycosyltransferase involved in cell wall biosynthesis